MFEMCFYVLNRICAFEKGWKNYLKIWKIIYVVQRSMIFMAVGRIPEMWIINWNINRYGWRKRMRWTGRRVEKRRYKNQWITFAPELYGNLILFMAPLVVNVGLFRSLYSALFQGEQFGVHGVHVPDNDYYSSHDIWKLAEICQRREIKY